MTTLQALRGMHDVFPSDIPPWQYVESVLRDILARYHIQEIRTPLLEKTELFTRGIGEVTDVVEKEMYTFPDRGNEMMTLRPEGTAGVARAYIEAGLSGRESLKTYYIGPMFRYERPQKGRSRQFHHCGIECIGYSGAFIEAELLALTKQLWDTLKIPQVRLEINTLGLPESRLRFREKLVQFLQAHRESLDEDSQRRLNTNPLRILDSKIPSTQAILQGAPRLRDFLSPEEHAHFAQLKAHLHALGIAYTENDKLVRGLDYYTHTVFEWVTDALGAQGTICGGGRYDGLIAQLGGKPTPAVGLAFGLERVIALLPEGERLPALPLIAVIIPDEELYPAVLKLVTGWRNELKGFAFETPLEGASVKSQFKRADKTGAHLAFIVGKTEWDTKTIAIKWLTGAHPQTSVSVDELKPYCENALSIIRGTK